MSLEGDNLSVMNAIRANEIGLSSGGALVADVFRLGGSNCVAHSLAKFARFVSDFVAWLEDPPDWLDVYLLHDVFRLNQ